MPVLVQINFRYNISDDQLHDLAMSFPKDIMPNILGLRWKIFAKDSAERTSCGIYLFDTMAHALEYESGDEVAKMKSAPAVSDLSIRISDVMTEESVLCGAPV